MASASATPECTGNSRNVGSIGNNLPVVVPQWKKDLIQRRKQQNKVLTSNGASSKLCTAMTGNFGTNNIPSNANDAESPREISESSSFDCDDNQQNGVDVAATRTKNSTELTSVGSEMSCVREESTDVSTSRVSLGGASGAIERRGSTEKLVTSSVVATVGENDCAGALREIGNGGDTGTTVVRNMRLETDASFMCPTSEDAPACNNRELQRATTLSGDSEFLNYDNCDTTRNSGNKTRSGIVKTMDCGEDARNITSRIINRQDKESIVGCCIYPSEATRKSRIDRGNDGKMKNSSDKNSVDECDSDSSEELQYGPGIVNRLKSKYLNLTLRETNKSRATVQRFRRAASLEDLLDCEDETDEKCARKFAKRNGDGGAPKTERYRNASRGAESMKRARSVETLMRYNSPSGDSTRIDRLGTARQEPVNDHIVLIDRSAVKIESRLTDRDDRPKAVNKPKRIKPLLSETERPPADLVKTTMRIFEGSVKKFKPKGEVAVKVATFKTINDTYKSQVMKKIVPKPPIQPKPFVNGNSRTPGSPKKIAVPQIPTAELIEKPEIFEEYRNDGVVTEPIVQSVSSVVSKFRQIEMSHSPSASPEPTYKVKFSPAPSPEPFGTSKLATSTESLVKSPPATPTPSPRLPSPGVACPTSPKRDLFNKQNSSPVTSPSSPNRELFRQISITEATKKFSRNDDEETIKEIPSEIIVEDSRQLQNSETQKIDVNEDPKIILNDDEISTISPEPSEEISTTDGTKKISKNALENISKAGTTICFNFGDKTTYEKNYLPGVDAKNSCKIENDKISTNGVDRSSKSTSEFTIVSQISQSSSSPMETLQISITEQSTRLQERFEPENSIETKKIDATVEYTKPIGAISSLGMIKSSLTTTMTTTTTSSNCTINDGKTIRNQKLDNAPQQKQIGIIRPLVSTKTQLAQQNLSNRELEKNLINRVKSIEQPTKVVVSLKSADEIQPTKKSVVGAANVGVGGAGGGGGGLWDTKPWNQANNTVVFNFSNRKDVPDYIENDGLIIRRKREKPKASDGGVIVLDATLDASETDDSDWEISAGPPSPCDVSFTNDNILINGRSNLAKQPKNHKHRIQFDDGATRTFEYPSEASILEDEGGTCVDGDASSMDQQQSSSPSSSSSSQGSNNKSSSTNSASTMSSALLGGGGLASFTPSKMDLASEGFELGVTRTAAPISTPVTVEKSEIDDTEDDYAKSVQDAAAWGAEANADLLY